MTDISESGWLRTDERGDVLASLSACLVCLERCGNDPGLWKWAILALHNATQGSMVCHLSGTANLGALTRRCAEEWLDWHERDRKREIRRTPLGTSELGVPRSRIERGDEPPVERLADAKELFKRLINEAKRIERGVGVVVKVSSDEKDAFAKLHDLRNDFAHFTPRGWSVELSGLPNIFLNVLNVIEQIADDPWPFRHMSEAESIRLRSLIGELRSVLERMANSALTRRAE